MSGIQLNRDWAKMFSGAPEFFSKYQWVMKFEDEIYWNLMKFPSWYLMRLFNYRIHQNVDPVLHAHKCYLLGSDLVIAFK